ncbi:MAG: hypothetical protein ABSG42_03605 [Nitrospirota bacterium]
MGRKLQGRILAANSGHDGLAIEAVAQKPALQGADWMTKPVYHLL